MSQGMAAERRTDLDRLRVLACLSTLFFHGLQIFSTDPYYHIKSATLTSAVDPVVRLLHAMRMPLFFMIAGMVAVLTLKRASNATYLTSRVLRLLPPFLIGIVLLTPWIKYFEIHDGRNISLGGLRLLAEPAPALPTLMWQYYTHTMRYFTWSHMWFPLYLLIISVLLLPVLRVMMAARAEKLPPILVLAMFLAAMVAIEFLLRPIYPLHLPNLLWDWANVATYAISFLLGASLVRWPNVEVGLQRAFALVALSATCGAVLYTAGPVDAPMTAAGRALWAWGLLGLVIAAGPLLARGTLPGEHYIGEGALAIYVLHHLPLVAIGFVVKDMPWPIWQRYGLIMIGAFAVTLALYHFVVRPFDWVRFCFGMPPRKARPAG